jgi:hypothetical protein
MLLLSLVALHQGISGPVAAETFLPTLVFTDSNYRVLESALAGQQVIATTTIGNANSAEEEYVLITEVRNDKDLTIFLQPRWTKVGPDGEIQLHHVWRFDQPGSYQVRSFLQTASCNPEVIAPVSASTFVVKPLEPADSVVPRFEDLTREQIKALSAKEVEAIEVEDIRRDEVRAEADDAETVRLEEKERRIRNIIWSDPRIVEYQRTVDNFGFDSDFRMDEKFCDDAEMTILVSRERHVEGDWQTSYTTTYSGRSQLDVSMIDGEIASIVDTALEDVTLTYNYTDQQKKVIQTAMADQRIVSLFGDDGVEVTGVRDYGVWFSGCEDKCAIAHLLVKGNPELGTAVLVDVTKGEVMSVRPSIKLISAHPERALAVIAEGEYLINVSFSKPLSKYNVSTIETKYNLKVNYVEYIATLNITGTSEYSTVAKLEHDLAFRHGAELVGITKFAARGEASDWLNFYRQPWNVSEFTAAQVIQ